MQSLRDPHESTADTVIARRPARGDAIHDGAHDSPIDEVLFREHGPRSAVCAIEYAPHERRRLDKFITCDRDAERPKFLP